MSTTHQLTKHRTPAQAGFDCACWMVAIVFATLVRFNLNVGGIKVVGLLKVVPLVVAAQLGAGFLFGMYRWRWRLGSFDEALALVGSTVACTAVIFTVNLLSSELLVPRSVPLAAGVTALALMAGGRCLWRLSDERRHRPQRDDAERLLVFGAGEAGAQIIRALLSNPDSGYVPVALLDDDVDKRNLRIRGVPVVGSRSSIAGAAAAWRADALLVAVPSGGSGLIADLTEIASATSLPVKVLPSTSELLDHRVDPADIRDVAPRDLLGRHEIHTDVAAIAGYLRGKRVLVTGAGGSIGSELCRQIYRFAPAELVMLDRDESGLHAVELSIHGRALLQSPDLALADLRDRAAVEALIAARRPQVIFHAAALKHLPLLESHPAEAVKTNVWATLDLLEIALDHGVERFVNISTDKAADPISVLGYSKRITERLTAFMARRGSMACLSVRFGNVLGSRGSVLSTFQAQIDRGGPLTVTDAEATRYFMTVEEAVELVVQAGAIGQGGEVLVLDMGEPVRIADIAQLLAQSSERPITVAYTGLRPGEKAHEALMASDEVDRRPVHPLISHLDAPALAPCEVRAIDLAVGGAGLIEQLADLCQRPVPVTTPGD